MNAQRTSVFLLDSGAGQKLSRALDRSGYRFRPAPHAHFQAQGEGVTVTWYRSGKLVVQGTGLEGWVERYAPDAAAVSATRKGKEADSALPDVAIGSDEAGKGDSFGALVVSAVAVASAAEAARLREAGVLDSKQLSDERVGVLAPWLRSELSWEEVTLEPAEYNRRYAEAGSNLNVLLTDLHAGLVATLAGRSGQRVAVVDRFSARSPVKARLAGRAAGLRVLEVPRAERCPAVAAASVLARHSFLSSLHALSEEFAVDLPKGSGSPTRPALRRFLQIHGATALGKVAKLHFKNVRAALEEA